MWVILPPGTGSAPCHAAPYNYYDVASSATTNRVGEITRFPRLSAARTHRSESPHGHRATIKSLSTGVGLRIISTEWSPGVRWCATHSHLMMTATQSRLTLARTNPLAHLTMLGRVRVLRAWIDHRTFSFSHNLRQRRAQNRECETQLHTTTLRYHDCSWHSLGAWCSLTTINVACGGRCNCIVVHVRFYYKRVTINCGVSCNRGKRLNICNVTSCESMHDRNNVAWSGDEWNGSEIRE